jgi:hypothetical protein
VGRIHVAVKAFNDHLAQARREMLADLKSVSDGQSDRFDKAVRELRDLDPSSALGQAVSKLEKGLHDLTVAVAATSGGAAERERGTAKGLSFESSVAAAIAEIAVIHGDRADATGRQQGVAMSTSRLSERGDITVHVSDTTRIVVESMDRARVTAADVQREVREAMENRTAAAGLAVVSSPSVAVMCGQPLQMLSDDIMAVVLDKADNNRLPLQLAYLLARRTALAAEDEACRFDIGRVRDAVDHLNAQLARFRRLKTELGNIGRSQAAASSTLDEFERELRTAVRRLVEAIEEAGGQLDGE